MFGAPVGSKEAEGSLSNSLTVLYCLPSEVPATNVNLKRTIEMKGYLNEAEKFKNFLSMFNFSGFS